MGTRGLTMVIKDSKPAIAQYGQWDHYPEGQGATALNFVSDPDNLAKLELALERVKFVAWDELEKRAIASGKFPSWPMVGYNDTEYDKMFPYMSRNYGATILARVAESDDEVIELGDNSDFVNDSLFCEQAYIIDLDAYTFEVYSGFVTTPNQGRFATDNPVRDEYYPITLAASWSLNALPSYDEFVDQLMKEDEDD